MKRIILHWTAGAHTPSPVDLRHYHFIIGGNGVVAHGIHKPEDNLQTRDGLYAAHTLNCNTGSIGVAVAAMAGAQERPFHPGKFPITEAQIEALVSICADLCRKWKISVTRETVLTHAEVQPTLGIKQRGKWDIAWIPGMAVPDDPLIVGDRLRKLISARLNPAKKQPLGPTVATSEPVTAPPSGGFFMRLWRALFGG